MNADGIGDNPEAQIERWYASAAGRPEWLLWGKAKGAKEGGAPAHPLLSHMLDVMAVARHLIPLLPRVPRRRLLAPLASGEELATNWLCVIIGLHDIGKASPAFQMKWEPARAQLPKHDFDLDPTHKARDHGTMSVAWAAAALEDAGFDEDVAWRLARAVAAHHGTFPKDADADAHLIGSRERGEAALWATARKGLVRELTQVLGELDPPACGAQLTRDHAFFAALAGLTAVADWIGSGRETFAYEYAPASTNDYWTIAMERAEEALARVGWRNLEQVRETDFGKLFGFPPRPLQQATADVAHRASSPALVLIEAPMGEGKTEAALHLAEAFASKVGQGGLYVGLPTQATADQMFRRVNAFLQSAHPKQRENLHLVHGSAILSKSYRELKLRAVYGEDDHASVVAEQWFCGPKRALLAAHAVGTIDQALLGVMRVKHGFVRLFGLTGKTVILDEVHAYDTYTSTLLDRLVAWLGALGASVVVLSATLPSSRRAKLLEAFAGRTVDCETPPYPRATVVDATSANSQRFDISRPEQHIAIEWLQDDAGVGATARALLEKVGDGGCAGWICNSVARSQRAFSELLHLRYTGSLPPDTRLLLLHSRFTMRERHERERELGRWLGPNDADRPRAAIIVGTQVLEQSLDVDFDVLASDLAPVDLVLQRAGRLHRHARDLRPERVKQPTLMLVAPAATTDPAPSFGVVARVYDSYIMARTWDVTRSLTVLKLPKNIEALVEAVYAKKPEQKTHRAQSSALARHQRSNAKASSSAAARLLPDPRSSDDPFGNLDMPFDEDSADIAEELRAKTRLGGPSCHVICLHRVHGTKRLEPTSTDVLNLDLQPDRALIQEFLLRSIPINNPELVQLLQAKDPPKSWARVALLRDRRPLLLDHGTASLGRYGVRLDDTLGLVLERSEEG